MKPKLVRTFFRTGQE